MNTSAVSLHRAFRTSEVAETAGDRRAYRASDTESRVICGSICSVRQRYRLGSSKIEIDRRVAARGNAICCVAFNAVVSDVHMRCAFNPNTITSIVPDCGSDDAGTRIVQNRDAVVDVV